MRVGHANRFKMVDVEVGKVYAVSHVFGFYDLPAGYHPLATVTATRLRRHRNTGGPAVWVRVRFNEPPQHGPQETLVNVRDLSGTEAEEIERRIRLDAAKAARDAEDERGRETVRLLKALGFEAEEGHGWGRGIINIRPTVTSLEAAQRCAARAAEGVTPC